MALSIKDEQTVHLVRRYAELHRTTYAGAIRKAVAEALKLEGHDIEEPDREQPFALSEVEGPESRVLRLRSARTGGEGP